MGTKNNPGQFDCYDAAEPDEPMFILLARDPLAPALVELWATLRAGTKEATERELTRQAEARACAAAMRLWQPALPPPLPEPPKAPPADDGEDEDDWFV